MGKHIDIRTDFGFKRIMGDPELLIFFLNALFEAEGKVITSVEYLDKEIIPFQKDERTTIFDILCRVDKGEDFIVEMQQRSQSFFAKRALYYMARAISNQGEKGKEWEYNLRPVYGIFITDFTPPNLDGTLPLSEVALMEKTTSQCFSMDFRMFFINLEAFTKTDEEDCQSYLDKWIFNFKHMGEMTEAPKMAETTPFCLLYDRAEVAAMSEEDQIRWERSLRLYRDKLLYEKTIEMEMQEARETGLAKGRAEGRAEGKIETAKKLMLELGWSAEKAAEFIGISVEELQ